MARIRSLHPGIATDEAFMAMTAYAKAAWPLLWMECDDNGVFEWKPLVLKARLLPADVVDLSDILNELISLGCVVRFDASGKQYGAVKNFAKYQRPKKPKVIHPITAEICAFVGLDAGGNRKEAGIGRPPSNASSERVTNHEESSTELGQQMKEEGGRRKEEGEKKEGSGKPPYAFVGKIVRLKAEQLEEWRKRFWAIKNLEGSLSAADDYYFDNPPKDGKWFFPVSKWLQRDHDAAWKARNAEDEHIYRNVQ